MFEQQQNTGKSASLAEKYANAVGQLSDANDRAAHAEHDLQVERITRQDLIDEEVARRVAEALTPENEKSNYFEYLLTKFSTPEEIFGPLSLTDLKQDRFHRKTAGYLPTVQVAFLDEIFKASSSILNALLTILNERKYHNGTSIEDIPLHA